MFAPHQFPEKMIPLFISNLLDGQRVPLYGDGMNVRDSPFAGVDAGPPSGIHRQHPSNLGAIP